MNINFLIKISLTYLTIMVFTNLFLSNNLVSKNKELNSLIQQKSFLQTEISRLTYVENELSSIEKLSQRASDLGFVKKSSPLLTIDISSYFTVAYNVE